MPDQTQIDKEREGKVIIIGAGGGIGSALTRQLVADGRQVVAAGRSEKRLKPLAEELGIEHHIVEGADFQAVEQLFKDAGHVSGAVNLAGSILIKSAHSTSREEWDATLEVNLTTAFALTRAAGRHMRSGGSVVLMSSSAACIGLASHEAIAAAKGGIIGLSRAAAASYAAQRVRVNCLAPGLTQTPLAEPITSREKARKTSEAMHPLGRLGEPEEVARLIAFLLDPANNWITGQCIGPDGGLSNVKA